MIEIQGLGFCYPGRTEPALKNINLQISDGSLFGLLGPNGAGKSTLLSILSGLLQCQQGNVQIGGLPLNRESAAIKRFAALVPQDFAFYPQLTARENLLFFARVLGLNSHDARAETERCIALTQLERHAGFRAATYSGGLKRRLNLAIGLLNHPRLIFLDEPTVGVDAQSRNFLLDSIRQLNQQGMTVIYTSHYMEEVQQLCDKVAIIDHGEIRLSGSLKELLHNRQLQIKVSLRTPASAEHIAQLQQAFTLHTDSQRQNLIMAADDSNAIAPLLQQLQQLQLTVDELHYGRTHRLEDVFLDTTDRTLRD